MTIERIQKDKLMNRELSAHGIHQAHDNVPFRILVTDFSKIPVSLPKDMLIALDTELPETKIAYHESAPLSKTKVIAVYY